MRKRDGKEKKEEKIMDFISDVTDFIFISSKPRISDVIFLPGGSDPALPEKGAELYKAG